MKLRIIVGWFFYCMGMVAATFYHIFKRKSMKRKSEKCAVGELREKGHVVFSVDFSKHKRKEKKK